MQTVTFSEADYDLDALLDKATKDGEPILIARTDGEDIIMISERGWAETIEALSQQWAAVEQLLVMTGQLIREIAKNFNLRNGHKARNFVRGSFHQALNADPST